MNQGTQEWLKERCGKVTASRVADVIAKTKSGYGASRKNYLAQLVAERLTGVPAESFTNAAMQWGLDHEEEARDNYAFLHAASVELAGFCVHPEIPESGASPDGYVEDDGLVEIKAPNTATHIETLLSQKIPDKYVVQMLWQMECTGRKWCDFVSYDPRMPANLQMWVKRIEYDEDRVSELRKEIIKFLAEVDETVEKLQALQEAS